MVVRKEYLDQLIQWKDERVIKVVQVSAGVVNPRF